MKSIAESPREWSSFVFNLIAPVYRRIDFEHSKHYIKAIELVNREVGIEGLSILDVGTGAGDWGAMFLNYLPQDVQGIDFAHRMIEVAQVKHPEIGFSYGNAENLEAFSDNSFDIVTASFVLHGASNPQRENMLLEMKRVSKKYLVLHDFMGPTPPFIQLLELLERSDYQNFKRNIEAELARHFTGVQKFSIKKGTGIYLALK